MGTRQVKIEELRKVIETAMADKKRLDGQPDHLKWNFAHRQQKQAEREIAALELEIRRDEVKALIESGGAVEARKVGVHLLSGHCICFIIDMNSLTILREMFINGNDGRFFSVWRNVETVSFEIWLRPDMMCAIEDSGWGDYAIIDGELVFVEPPLKRGE